MIELKQMTLKRRIRSIWRETLLFTSSGIVTLAVGSGLLLVFRSVTSSSSSLDSPARFEPTEQAILFAIVIFLISLSALLKSFDQKLGSFFVRKHLISLELPFNKRAKSALMGERVLIETWFRFVSGLAQLAGFSVLLIFIAGPVQVPGALVALTLGFIVGKRHFTNALKVAQNFLQAGNPRENHGKGEGSESVDERETLVSAIYERDVGVFRLPMILTGIGSLLGLTALLVVPVATGGISEIALYSVAIILWHQRYIDSISSAGQLAWAIIRWQSKNNPEFWE